jgi:flagellar motor switch protein FliN/FliY
MDESKTTETPAAGRAPAAKPENPGFRAASFQQIGDNGGTKTGEAHPSLDVIMDVPVTLSLEVGRAQMSVGSLLRLTQGSVVELDRNAGEPLDVLVNGALVAHGEIVVVNDKFGIRLTDVVAPPARKAG